MYIWQSSLFYRHVISHLSLSHSLAHSQLTVYNYDGGPCYRCLYPTPPPPHTVTNCSDGGVLGAGEYKHTSHDAFSFTFNEDTSC